MTFLEWNRRSCRLANALLGLGLARGDRVAVLAYNCVEWAEIYVAAAKAGLIAVPINFRLVAAEVALHRRGLPRPGAVIAQDALHGLIEEVRGDLPVPARNYVHFGGGARPAGWQGYEALLAAASDGEPELHVAPPTSLDADVHLRHDRQPERRDPRATGGMALLALMTEIELGIHRERRRAPGHADVPCQLGQLLRRLQLLRRDDQRSTRARASTRSTACGRWPRRRDLHLAGSDALQHDAGLPAATRAARLRPRCRS